MRNFRTLTVNQLLNLLEGEDPDALVVVSCDYGDICHTQQAIGFRGELIDGVLTDSAYSHSGKAVVVADEEEYEDLVDDEDRPAQRVMVLR